jgi:hypothetical protein
MPSRLHSMVRFRAMSHRREASEIALVEIRGALGKILPVEQQGPDSKNDSASVSKLSGTKKMLLASLVVSGLVLLALLLTIWLGGEPPPLSVDYDGFD